MSVGANVGLPHGDDGISEGQKSYADLRVSGDEKSSASITPGRPRLSIVIQISPRVAFRIDAPSASVTDLRSEALLVISGSTFLSGICSEDRHEDSEVQASEPRLQKTTRRSSGAMYESAGCSSAEKLTI